MLVVYNTCGISGREDTGYYIKALESILNQNFPDFKVVLSSCLNSLESINLIKRYFGDDIEYNCILDRVPVSVSFNDSVDKCISKFGEFDSYLFVDSGIDFSTNDMVLSGLHDLLLSGPYSMVSARTDTDTGMDDWFKTDVKGDSLFSSGHFEIPVGKAINLHVQLFSESVRKTYGRILPDIFAGQCMESVFSFLAAAIKTKWVVHQSLILKHLTGMDGPSSGFAPHKHVQETGKPRWDHVFASSESIKDIISRGLDYGMGYEENQGIFNHLAEKYDENGFCLDEQLKSYIRDNLFLPRNIFDYSKIRTNNA